MSAELAHFKCGRCSAVEHQTLDCILGYAQLWQSTVKVVLGYLHCGIVQAHALFVGKGSISCLAVFATY